MKVKSKIFLSELNTFYLSDFGHLINYNRIKKQYFYKSFKICTSEKN